MPDFHFSPRPNRAHEIAWREWSDSAFAEAREQDKPILLGISAVWCHWCHVMDETSYSDPVVIQLVNERFIPIRVDNDQRPDVNRRYNLGGWPTTAFLTPDGELLTCGTYVPPEQMRAYLIQVSEAYRQAKPDILQKIAVVNARAQRYGTRAQHRPRNCQTKSLLMSFATSATTLTRSMAVGGLLPSSPKPMRSNSCSKNTTRPAMNLSSPSSSSH